MNEGTKSEKGLRILQIVVMIALSLINSLLVPWAWSVTSEMKDVRVDLATLKEWKAIGPRFTSSDAETLRLRVLQETSERVEQRMTALEQRIIKGQDSLEAKLLAGQLAMEQRLRDHIVGLEKALPRSRQNSAGGN